MTWAPVPIPSVRGQQMMQFAQPVGGAGNSISSTDPDFANVKILLHGNGVNGSVVLTDSSPVGRAITVFGDTQISTAIKKYNTGSIAFDGTGDYATAASSADFQPGSGNFAVEAWVYQTANTGGGALFGGVHYQNIAGNIQIGSASNASFNLTLASGKPTGSVYQSGVDKTITAASAIALNTWTHLLFGRCGGVLLLAADGVPVAVTTITGSVDASTRVLGIGGDATGSARLFGYIDDLRITKGGTTRQPCFTPPTAEYPNS